MKSTFPTRLAGGLCAALTASLVIIACAGTTSFRVGANIAGAEGTAEFHHDSSTRKVRITNGTGEAMDVSFRDANGNPVGSTSHGVASGGSVDVPAGATEVVVSTPATPPPPTGGTGGHMAEIDEDGNDRFGGVSFDCNVLAPAIGWDAQTDGWNLVSPILFAGPGTPVPTNVDVVSFVRVKREKLGARIVAADLGRFTNFQLDWNGVYAYADLAAGHGVNAFSVANGWGVCEAFIPLADFDLPTNLNGGTITMANTGDPQPQQVSTFVRFFP